MMTVEEYAIDLVCVGAESTAEDDLNEDGQVADADHQDACDLAIQIAHAIREHPDAALAMVGLRPWPARLADARRARRAP